MPQFDFISFFVQIVWFIFFTVCFYLTHLIYFSKNISEGLKMRAKLKNFASILKQKVQSSELYKQVLKRSGRNR